MTDNELIKKIIEGNQLYFKKLVDQYQSMVLNTCFQITQNKEDAEDITQEVFIEVYRSINKFNQHSKLSTWLYRIAVNKSLNFLRKNKKRKIFKSIENFFNTEKQSELQIPDQTIQSDTNDIHEKRIKLLRKAIQNLPEKQKTAFVLNKYQELSYKEIAEIMDTSLASVEGLIHRAKLNVQKYILKKL